MAATPRTIDLSQLSRELKRAGKNAMDAIKRGAWSGAQASRTLLVHVTPVNTGQLKNAWKAYRKPDPEVVNEAPHAGIVERGARPHAVSRAGIASLTRWAELKLGLSEKEARGVAFAIAHKLRTKGQAPTFFVRNQLGRIVEITRNEVVRELRRAAQGRGRR